MNLHLRRMGCAPGQACESQRDDHGSVAMSRVEAEPTVFRSVSILHYCAMMLLMVAVATACGRKHETTVTGKITLNGKPLSKGEAKFYAVQGGACAYGGIQPDGSYEIHAPGGGEIAPGDYLVTVVAADLLPVDPRTKLPGRKIITPRRHGDVKTTDLRCTISLGKNQIDFDLIP